MALPAKIKKLDQVVVNRIAAGEIIQKPANALKELIENSLDAKAGDIQITVKDGGLKLLQIQDNGTGIRKEDLEIVCERFTTSKLSNFDDLHSLSTYGFRGEALASISHVAQLTITTKTAEDKVAYRATYIDGKLKGSPKALAGNQGTTITIENLFYNVPQRKKALDNISEQFALITEVVTRYAIHNSSVAFTLKKQGENSPYVRTPVKSDKINNIKLLYGQPVAREIISIDLEDSGYKFKLQALITNPNYSSKKLVFLLFINHRLVESTLIRKMLDDLYSIYLPKKTHPWCYISLEIDPNNVDVNVHPTKSQVKFLHEEAIVERVKGALDEKLSSNNASRTFYAQARLPQVDITKEALGQVLPEFAPTVSNEVKDKSKVQASKMVRTDHQAQKLESFNFTVSSNQDMSLLDERKLDDEVAKVVDESKLDDEVAKVVDQSKLDDEVAKVVDESKLDDEVAKVVDDSLGIDDESWMEILNDDFSEISKETKTVDLSEPVLVSKTAERALQTVKKLFGSQEPSCSKEKSESEEQVILSPLFPDIVAELTPNSRRTEEQREDSVGEEKENAANFKSYSVNSYRRPVELTSILRLRKRIEDNYHGGLRKVLTEMIFIGCIDECLALFQSDVNLYICKVRNLAEELFYEIMLYDFANYGVLKFSSALSVVELAKIGLGNKGSGWSKDRGSKEQVAEKVRDLLVSKAEMLKEYFAIVITKNGFIRSLPVLLDDYCPDVAGELPMFVLRLATEVDWTDEQKCFDGVCRETARFYSKVDYNGDWRHLIEYVLFPAVKESLLPPKEFAHDSSIYQIASLPDLYKVFERC